MPSDPDEVAGQLATLPLSHVPPQRLCPTCPTFLDLPPEIRNAIYDHLFPPGKAAAQLLARRNGGYITMSDRLNFITACRQVFEETMTFMRGNGRINVVQPKDIFERIPIDNKEDWSDAFVHQQIVDRVLVSCGPDDGQVFMKDYDLTAGTFHSHFSELLHISHDIRSWAEYSLFESQTSVTMTTNKPNSYLDIEFSRLKAKIETGCMERFNEKFRQVTHVNITYDLVSAADVKNVRFPVTALLHALDHDSVTGDTWTQIKWIGRQDYKLQMVGEIRKTVLKYAYRCIQRHLLRGLDPCPVLWMDCRFQICDANFTNKDGEPEALRDVEPCPDEFLTELWYAEDWLEALRQLEVKTCADVDDRSIFLDFAYRLASRLTPRWKVYFRGGEYEPFNEASNYHEYEGESA